MKKMPLSFLSVLVIGLLFLQSCEEPFEPEVNPQTRDVMLVEGHLQSGLSTLSLSKAVALNEEGWHGIANVSIRLESIDKSYAKTFFSMEPGKYMAHLNLQESKKYKLVITDFDGNIYESDEIPVNNSPPIESLDWDVQNEKVRILASSSGESDKSRFYRYEFVETWKYRSAYLTSLQYVDGRIITLPLNERYWECYKTEESTNIVLANSADLAQNIISNEVITEISPIETSRLNVRYSILVKQITLNREAYDFYDQLKANTEELGTLFDPQPFELGSNIHHINGDKEVIGYITAGNISEKRIFIDNIELPFEIYNNDYIDCVVTELPPYMSFFPYTYYLETEDFLPLKRISTVKILASSSFCVDCRLQGGVIEKPAFW